MQGKYAILIDAGFLKRKLGSQENPTTAQDIVNFTKRIRLSPVFENKILHRIYYYDSEPFKGSRPKPLTGGRANGTIVDFSDSELFAANETIIKHLRKEPYFAIRLGETVFRGWNVKPQKLDPKKERTEIIITADDIRPDIQQKGVDMRIGLDIAALTLKEHVDLIALVTGDSDFVPALKFARKEGIQVALFTLGHSIKDGIIEHTDFYIGETLDQIKPTPKARQPFPFTRTLIRKR